jgi:type IV secretory pathway VirB6-like protein
MDPSTIGIILCIIGFIILLTIFAIGFARKEKLKSADYGLQVTLPNIIGLVLVLIGTSLRFKGADDLFFHIMIPVTAIGGIYVSLISIMNSAFIMRWQGS